jgi:hypothetical protein
VIDFECESISRDQNQSKTVKPGYDWNLNPTGTSCRQLFWTWHAKNSTINIEKYHYIKKKKKKNTSNRLNANRHVMDHELWQRTVTIIRSSPSEERETRESGYAMWFTKWSWIYFVIYASCVRIVRTSLYGSRVTWKRVRGTSFVYIFTFQHFRLLPVSTVTKWYYWVKAVVSRRNTAAVDRLHRLHDRSRRHRLRAKASTSTRQHNNNR